MALELRNPHSVLAALDERPRGVLEVRLFGRHAGRAWGDVARLAESHRIPVRHGVGPEARRDRKEQARGGRSGAGEATVLEREDRTLEALFAGAERGEAHGLWLALDQLQDPHNVGAIFRAAAFFGIDGIVLTRERSAPLNATVYDVASGGVETVPFSIQSNLARAIETAKDAGLWVLGAAERAEQDVFGIPRDRPWLLVLGNEERGLRRLTLAKCDQVCRITPRGRVTSLNVSVAAGILMAVLRGPS